MAQRFVTKRVEVEAIRFDGSNFEELQQWTTDGFDPLLDSDGSAEFTAEVWDFLHESWIKVRPGQWIIRGTKGEFYPCDDETFRWKYEEVTE